jgi:3-phenylpropionate/trans-cinnamate dioxygenase ferredoxin reductase subunit
MEVASSCVARGVEATIIERDEHPWPAFASPALGNFIREYYEARGVKFATGEEVSAFVGDGSLTAVHTKGGQAVEADFAVVGVGAVLNTQLAVDAGLEADAQGVRVNSHLQTSDPNIWAAGDIACFEDVALGKQWHVEHFMNAKWQGTTAGTNMAGEATQFARVPFFFSDILDLHMCLRGDPGAGEETEVLGDLKGGEFVELYHDDSDRLRMGVVVSRDDDWANSVANALNSLVREGADVKTLDARTFES